FPPYHPLDPTGDHAVATATRTVDGITLGIWYPEGASDPLPLVVFSHGSMGVRDSNLSLYLDLASHGYLVVSPDHPGHALMSKDMDGHRSWIDRGYLDELRREDASLDPEGSLISYRKWMGSRIANLASVIDAVA